MANGQKIATNSNRIDSRKDYINISGEGKYLASETPTVTGYISVNSADYFLSETTIDNIPATLSIHVGYIFAVPQGTDPDTLKLEYVDNSVFTESDYYSSYSATKGGQYDGNDRLIGSLICDVINNRMIVRFDQDKYQFYTFGMTGTNSFTWSSGNNGLFLYHDCDIAISNFGVNVNDWGYNGQSLTEKFGFHGTNEDLYMTRLKAGRHQLDEANTMHIMAIYAKTRPTAISDVCETIF